MSRARIEKLRRMAEHPSANPHEAAVAREELARLLREQPAAASAPAPAPSSGFSVDSIFEWLANNLGDVLQQVQVRQAMGVFTPGELGYYAWARTLKERDVVRICRTGYGEDWKTGEVVFVKRMTKTQYIMSNGEKYRRAGKFPGYKVGESARQGYRKFLAKLK